MLVVISFILPIRRRFPFFLLFEAVSPW